jgi:L-rhamnose mutarotase
MRRMGWVIGIRPDRITEYKAFYAEMWPSLQSRISAFGIRNFTIYLREPENLLFATFEYDGEDFERDLARLAEEETTRRWLALTDPCQRGLDSRKPGEWWAPMDEVFHLD